MELRDALAQITEIRETIARAETFRGYRAAPVACSGLLAMLASAVQARWLPDPSAHLGAYLGLWIGVAVLSMAAAGSEMYLRARRSLSPLSWEITRLAIEQFLPCVVAGALATAVIAREAPEAAWMLPGLWSLLFSLGVFASCRLLPRATFWVAVYYLVAGIVCLMLARGPAAFSPWSMVLSFGVGQLLAAAVLYWKLERGEDWRP